MNLRGGVKGMGRVGEGKGRGRNDVNTGLMYESFNPLNKKGIL